MSMNSRRHVMGVAALEFALLIVPLVMFTLTTVEASRALYYYNTLLKSTRDAARYLTMQAPGTSIDEAKCLAVYGNTTCSGTAVVPGLTVGMVGVSPAAVQMCTDAGHEDCFGTMDLVKVRVSGYQFRTMMVPLLPDTIGTFTFGEVATSMRQAAS